MQVNRIVALGGACVAVLGAACGAFLALPAEMSAPRPAAAVITAHDPNYVAYLKMLASLGPAPARTAPAARPLTPWTEVATEARHSADDEWIEVVDEEEEEPQPPPVMRRRAPPVYAVIYDEPPAPEYRRYAPAPEYRRAAPYYPPRPWGGERIDPPARYGGYDAGEPVPPPPPLPSGY